MDYAQLVERLKKDLNLTGSKDELTEAIKEVMAPLLKAEEKEIMTRVQTNVHNLAGSGGFVRTKQGSLVNPMAIMGAPEQRIGNYWQELSSEMDHYMKNFGDIIKTRGRRKASNDMTVDSNEDGGFLVPEEFIASIVEYVEPANIVWPRATVVPMRTDRLRMPKLAQVSQVGTNLNHFGGVSFSWLDETDIKTKTNPTFEELALNAHKLAGYTAISDELLMDSPINLANYLTNLLGRAWKWVTDAAFFTANGAGKPLGIVNDPAVIRVARQTAGTVTLTDINNMYAALPAPFNAGAIWTADKATLAPIQNERDLNNAPLIREAGYAVRDGLVPVMKGHRVVESDGKTPTIGNQGDVIIGNWQHYYIGNRQNMDIRSSEHILFLEDMTAIRITGRIDGQAAQPKAFVILDDAVAGS